MQRYNVREAKDHLSKLVDDALEGQRVLITRNGVTVAELIPFRRRPFPLGVGRNDVLINRETLRRDDWWRSISNSTTGESAQT